MRGSIGARFLAGMRWKTITLEEFNEGSYTYPRLDSIALVRRGSGSRSPGLPELSTEHWRGVKHCTRVPRHPPGRGPWFWSGSDATATLRP